MINLNNIPVEPTATILNPDGIELINTNNITTFTYIRLEIKKNALKGYKVRDDEGNVYDILPNGKIFNDYIIWPGNLPGDIFDELLSELI